MMHAGSHMTCTDANYNICPEHSILVFEQDEYLASLLHMLISREGFHIDTITDPDSALQHIHEYCMPHLIFIDESWLDENTGLPDFLHTIRNKLGWLDVPIILLSRYFCAEQIDSALNNGISDYILQPFGPGELLDQIQHYMVPD